jgi:signal transduction histidine kinase/ActR/RegA family two-component response regulator
MAAPANIGVAVLTPSARDAPVTCALLARAGIPATEAHGLDDLCRLLDEGAGAALVAEEVFARGAGAPLAGWLARQPPWSELPVVVFTAAGAAATARSPALDLLGTRAHVTLVDRPVRLVTLVSAVSGALRLRDHQLRMRDLLDRLAESVRTRDQFLAMLGHELRNPLAAIHTATELLLRSPAQAQRPGTIIARQTRKLSRLVDDMLEVSRVESGKIALRRAIVDLRECVERSVEAAAPQAERAGLSLSVSVAPEPVPVDGDPVRLEQVVGNLLSNAVKYTPSGGKVTVVVERVGDAAVLRVSDTGVGVDPANLDRIFEPFAQISTSLDRSQGGLGLGLSLVRGLVALHNGSVQARSEGIGRGTELEVRLPVSLSRAESVAPSPARAPRTGPRRHVLVVEDNPDACEALVMLLESFGHQVVAASDGPGGVDAATRAQPEVAFVDIGLPGFDGYEVGRRVRELLGSRIVLVALTGYGQDGDRVRAEAAGFDLHLTKPADSETVAAIVARAGVGLPSRAPTPSAGAPCP